MRWWGWGEDAEAPSLPPAADALLREELGATEGSRPVGIEDVRVPDPSLPDGLRERLAKAVGEDHVRDDREARVEHAVGRSYPDLVRIRSGDGGSAPDAVVAPGSSEQVGAVLRECADAQVAVVPFGGGTSVVGGVEPLRDGFAAVVSLDLRRMDALLSVDPVSLTAVFQPGILGPEAERALAAEGLTLGHFPQSFEYSTVGGWVATRSAGQASTGYGRIDELVEGLCCVTPAGELRVPALPASAAGPALKELLVGSEGALGVLSELTLRVRPLPQARRYEGWSFRSFEEGVEAFRVMEQSHASPDIARLSDEEETRLTLGMSSSGSRAERLGRAYLRLRGHEGGCIVIVGFEGEEDDVASRRRRTAALLRAGGGVALGSRPGAAWSEGRYRAPYLRDELLDRGVMVETLETATSWSGLLALHHAVRDAIRGALAARGVEARVMCHVSHLYPSGASLYFTFLARQEQGAELEQWHAVKKAASDAIVRSGATITHHHAVGRDHAPWMRAEVGELGLQLLREIKDLLDPAGIMNPGKLLPGAGELPGASPSAASARSAPG
jgi:alkyldihydroxyacetonephosphate synthase